jgi:1,4-alpha-glucan branching enzyme
MAYGHLLLVLHCHLPYVRHPEHDEFLEEDWFFEAVAETYLPLLLALERLEADGVPFPLALSVSPTLCEMLSNDLLGRRLERYLDRHVELAEVEVRRTQGTPFAEPAAMYRGHYGTVREAYRARYGGDLLGAFRRLHGAGRLELLGSAATHALLPLTGSDAACRAQVEMGLRSFRRHFGFRPDGFWLPECAYGPGVSELLSEFGVRFTFLDTHGVLLADPAPECGVFAPLATAAGPLAFGRDVESGRQVWSADEGYPGDAAYREFHRDLGYEAPLDCLGPCRPRDGVRRPIGFKYYRVTGDCPLEAKEPYDPGRAAARVAEHAAHFVAARAAQARRVARAIGRPPVIVAPYDAELFGHWWFEGVQFLESVARLVAPRSDLAFTLPSRFLNDGAADGRPWPGGEPATSSWGNGGCFDPWLNGSNDWVWTALRRAEVAMRAAAGNGLAAAGSGGGDGPVRRALDQCARQVMLAQASDWPFLIYTGTARQYASWRVRSLLERFDDLMRATRRGGLSEHVLARYEWLDDPFPDMDYRLLAGKSGRRLD